jgi:hypothetical protein
MNQFFEWAGAVRIEWWFVEAQARTANGERGAPLGKAFGMAMAFHHSRASAAFAALERRIRAHRKRPPQLDLITRESPSRAGGRILLIDDLDGIAVDDLIQWWPGSVAVLETSPGNHQALVVSPTPLALNCQRRALGALVARFDGDPAAAHVGQPHRLPGSHNWKAECLDAGGPFLCRAVHYRVAKDLAASRATTCLAEIARTAQDPLADRGRVRPSVQQHGVDRSNSAKAFGWTCKALRDGVPEELILEGLSTVWLSHHDPGDWPSRTLRKAKESQILQRGLDA